MAKPKDRRNEFMRQHQRILAEATERDQTIERLRADRDKAIEAATKPLRDALAEAQEHLALVTQKHDGLVALLDEATIYLADLMGQLRARDATIATLKADGPRVEAMLSELEAKHNKELEAVRSDITRMNELAERIHERGRRREAVEADAIANRVRMATLAPRRNYRA
jgi:chromosome segregation ATPase